MNELKSFRNTLSSSWARTRNLRIAIFCLSFLVFLTSGSFDIHANEIPLNTPLASSEVVSLSSKEILFDLDTLPYIDAYSCIAPIPHWDFLIDKGLHVGDTLLLKTGAHTGAWEVLSTSGSLQLIETITELYRPATYTFTLNAAFRFKVVDLGPFHINLEREDFHEYDFCNNLCTYTLSGEIK